MDNLVDLSQCVQQLDAFRQADCSRDQMIRHLKDILVSYDRLQTLYRGKCDDYENERESRRMWQTKASNLGQQVTALNNANESNRFVFVIIDGDGAVFQDALLKRGADGGAEAGYQLSNEIRNYVTDAYPEAASEDWSIIVQVVLNLEGLAKKLHSAGIIPNTPDARTLADFGRGFGRGQPLFSFVDVGAGKESADHKIREILRVMVRITQCKHIFFGPCHDNGYLPVLEPYNLDPKVSPRLTLIETTPAEEGFKRLNFHRISFKSVFRSDKLPERYDRPVAPSTTPPKPFLQPAPQQTQAASAAAEAAAVANAMASTHIKSAPASNGGALLRSNTNDSQPPRVTSPPSIGGASTASSWSKLDSNGTLTRTTIAPVKTIDISSKKPPARKYYLLNAESQRVDEPLPRPDPMVEKRFYERMEKVGKFCNNYHLLGQCRNGDSCSYYHGDKLSPGEMTVLRQKSRGNLCNHGSDCFDVNCTNGHHCRWLKNCEHSNCRFVGYHDIDTKPRLKVFEDGDVQPLAK
ncbi:C-x8-C-x5-C-x3-H type zinc finger protein [Colletotrichum musicola]|uniref:C-x8-C-x5-C-x3-H type zinc finger protein n=1 Tax=Colletotrichum musicola TaxID=2175873 RepID=A0A8H6UAA2_9PEZI|nr:C-x8-C-x5-C-x3-H type zinc finger protein [Colletotrichum musicola]